MQNLKTTEVFERNIKALNSGVPLVANQGGQGSSKTVSILQVFFLLWFHIKNLRITFASYALPHLKSGVVNDFERVMKDYGLNIVAYKNKSEMIYTSPTGSKIECIGIEGNEAKATGPRRDYLYVNEANKRIRYEVFELMNSRTHKATFIDFNPSAPFWFHEKIQPNFEHELIKSNFLMNPYLPESEKRNILSKKDKPGFENWWTVYGLGELGRLEGAIYNNWEYGDFDETLPDMFGLDYGFDHPDAFVRVAIDEKRKIIYADECFYKSGQNTDQLIKSVKDFATKDSLIIAESATPRTNEDLKPHFNIKAVEKTKTVVDWIKVMQTYKIVITERSHNLAKELMNYVWDDRKSETPIKTFDDLLDAIRYCLMYTKTKKKPVYASTVPFGG